MKPKIEVAADMVAKMDGASSYEELVSKASLKRLKRLPNWTTNGMTVQAKINHSRWVVDCPYCPESLPAQPGLPMYCPNCGCVENGGFALTVVFPEEREQIEAVLLKRPLPQNRNWEPGEDMALLLAENVMAGIT